MELTLLKMIHVATAAVSYALFVVRGVWMISGSPRLGERWVRIVPHVNDTLLLAAGIWMTILTHQYPGVHAWLTAKVIGLLAYIGLGMVALKHGTTRRVRVAAWIAAQAMFFYIVAVALTRNPLPFGG
ncbi:MAG: SirB2 family protein [Betaproteobacteria bacterium]|nr:SirB2 family protein [Betaproteobacteria bacterium]